MKEEKFKVINFIRELIIYIDKNLENFPRKEIEIKNRIRNISYELLELAYMANITKYDKNKYIEEIIAKVKVLDFLLNLCYDKQIINSKRYVKFGEKLQNLSSIIRNAVIYAVDNATGINLFGININVKSIKM